MSLASDGTRQGANAIGYIIELFQLSIEILQPLRMMKTFWTTAMSIPQNYCKLHFFARV